MKPKVNIVVLVDTVGALSDRTLHNGNLSLVDDGSFDSQGQGTPDLCTVVGAGQIVQWTALAVDVQTPVEIRNITFLGADSGGPGHPHEPGTGYDKPSADHRNLDLEVWAGVVPAHLTPGVPYRYRLEVQMHEGPNSVLHIDSPALMCA
jgi:hypothetical protein